MSVHTSHAFSKDARTSLLEPGSNPPFATSVFRYPMKYPRRPKPRLSALSQHTESGADDPATPGHTFDEAVARGIHVSGRQDRSGHS